MAPRRQAPAPPPFQPPKRSTRGKIPAKNKPPSKTRLTTRQATLKAKVGTMDDGKPKTLIGRILFIIQDATNLVGMPTVKKRLIDEFDMTDSPSFRKKVAKALAKLSECDRADFGKIGGSYHGGEDSAAYLAYEEAQEAMEEEEKMKDAGCTKCCWCAQWCDDDCFIREDSIGRGSKYKCIHCDRIYWTWISDGYVYGHDVEFKKGADNFCGWGDKIPHL
ncbi:Aste57867_9952 [Aphanomyces stellatus]|uniref:Aste57867_9952 protein n=1 Tax=Aphanomyces stellatus TaxID=120398 RepID=A0A485KPF2_9STRA|nr:hypothetical protein As57867_009913 [Aphanomyces stellatus]VFT86830.1 Aste57867_9952 [Aphanomyces stellatus]